MRVAFIVLGIVAIVSFIVYDGLTFTKQRNDYFKRTKFEDDGNYN